MPMNVARVARAAAPNEKAARVAQAAAGDDESLQPRYVQILQALRERIENGTYAIGSLIPTEAELCGEFGASRFTVREALRRLVESGMVGRRKGSGTFVTATTPQAALVHSLRTLSELFQYALDTVYEIDTTGLVKIDAETAALLEAEAGERWFRVAGVRRMAETREPICYTIVHVDAAFAPLLKDVRTLKTPIYAAVEERSGESIAEAVQEIRAAAIPPAIAKELSQPRGSWALLVARRYVGREGQTLLCSLNWHPADRFRYTMRMQRGDAPT